MGIDINGSYVFKESSSPSDANRQINSSRDAWYAVLSPDRIKVGLNRGFFHLSPKCPPGFFGEKCEHHCTDPSPNDRYLCTSNGMKCFNGWTGPKCAHPICKFPCANGGICIAPDQCSCREGWHGPNCDECVPRTGCKNGLCTTEPFKCICLSNWTGRNCDILINKCLEKPCKNGGVCTTLGRHGHFYQCLCPSGFTSVDCSIKATGCQHRVCGRNGRCIPLGQNDYTCTCENGFFGVHCEHRIETSLPMDGGWTANDVVINTPQLQQLGQLIGHNNHQHQAPQPSPSPTFPTLQPITTTTPLVDEQTYANKLSDHFWTINLLFVLCILLLRTLTSYFFKGSERT